jgi:DNA polymerase III epsilon subunit-like protein
MRTIIIDMETTGLNPHRDDVWNIAWLLVEGDKVVKYRDRYYPIKKFGYDYWKFSFDYVEKDGLIYPRKYKANKKHHWTKDKELIKDVMTADIIVGHKVDFELGFLGLIIPEVETKAQYCTMYLTTNICKLPFPYDDEVGDEYKWPKLQEAYYLLVEGQGLSGLERYIPGTWHDARYDVFAALRIYEYMTQTKFDISWYIWLQAGVVRGYLKQLKNTMDFKLWILKSRVDSQLGKLKNNILRTVFKKDVKDDEEIPF